MTDVIYFKPRRELTAEQNLNDFIAYCRDSLTLYNDQGGWEVNNWHHHGGRKIAMTFSKYRKKSNPANFDPLEEPFLSFSKAYIRYTQSIKAVSSVTIKMVALRYLHDALVEVHQEANILKTDGLVISKLEELTRLREKNADRLNKVGYQIEALLDFIRKEKAFVPILQVWKNPWPKVRAKAERTDKKSREWQEERCPSMHQMFSLAECFANASTKEDKYWSSIMVLLMFAPGRAGELRDLTVDCLHRGENGALGVRWYGEKGFGHSIKWVPKDLEAAVLKAHKRLSEITEPARKAARFAYENPDVFLRHEKCVTPKGFPEDKPLNAYEFAYAMSFVESTIGRMVKKTNNYDLKTAWNVLGGHQVKWIQALRKEKNPSYRDLARFIAKEYKDSNWPQLPSVDRPIWESLVLIRDREFHNEHLPRAFSWYLPSVNELNAQLSPRDKLKNPPKTIFQRMGYVDEDGSTISLTSHQLRVWLSTNGERGGMDTWKLARWAGRARINDNRHYDLRTQGEREEQARQVLMFDEPPTALEAIKINTPVTYENLGINRIGIADVTEYGMCTHDYAMSPCTKGGGEDCMICKEHVCIKGMPKTLERIKELEKKVESQFEKAKVDGERGVFNADTWVDHFGWKLSHIRTQRIRMESEETPEGAILWIPPEHDPSPTKRALRQRGLQTQASEDELVDESTVAMLLGVDDA